MTEPIESRPTARRGRRPGPSSTRRTVLGAARARFAASGFAGTTIRRVAADAGVDPSQVIQFFHSKDELFAEAMSIPASALHRFDTAFEGPDDHLGERVVRGYLEAWDAVPEESEPLMAMLRGAVANERAAEQFRQFIQSRLVHGLVGRGDDDVLRASIAAAMLVGITLSRRIIGVPALAETDLETIVATAAPSIQMLLVGSRTPRSEG